MQDAILWKLTVDICYHMIYNSTIMIKVKRYE
jgi:hypothetical protein